MWEILSTVLTSVLGGGATGLLGVLLQRFFDWRKAQQDVQLMQMQLEAARETRRIELEHQERMAGRVADMQALEMRLDAEAREIEAAERAFIASHASDRATYSAPSAQEQSRLVRWLLGFVDGVRGLMRPGITVYTLWMLTVVFLWVRSLYEQMGLKLTQDQVHDLTQQSVGTIFYLATTCVVWWFGVRPAQPPAKR